MAIKENLDCEVREPGGTTAAKALRKQGKIPGVVYAKGAPATHVSVDAKKFAFIRRRHGLSSLVHLQGLGDEEVLAIYKNVQVHPVSHEAIHIDFHGCEAGEPLSIMVDVRLTGLPVGVDKQAGSLIQARKRIRVTCLPKDIPDYLMVDVTHLEIGDSIHAGDAGFDEKYTLEHPEITLATVTASRELLRLKEEEEKAAAEAAEGLEGEGVEGAAAEGAAPEGEGGEAKPAE